MSQIAIIGAGAWGTGLAVVLGRSGNHEVRLWAHEQEVRDSISARRVNEQFLPGQLIPTPVSPTGSLEVALDNAEIVVSVMPSQHCRALFQQMLPHLKPAMLFVSATKGLEENTLLRMTEVVAQVVAVGQGFYAADRSAEWTIVRQGSCARRSHGHHCGLERPRTRGDSAARIQRSPIPYLYQRRCRRS